MIYKIYEDLLSFAIRMEYYDLFFFLCDKFPKLSEELDKRMESEAEEGRREYAEWMQKKMADKEKEE